MWLRQSTASQEILLGRFVDSTDGNTEETGLTIANTDIKLWVEGATTLASKNSGGATHIANGMYYAVLDATDTATLGKLEVHVHVSGALAVKREYIVLPAMIYDSLVLGTDRFDVNVTHVTDTAQTARDIGASVLLSSGTGTGQLDFTSGVVKANVTQFGGSAGTFASGRPEVNTTHAAGTAWGSGAITSGAFASGAITAAAIATDAIGAAELAADAVSEIVAAVGSVPSAATVAAAVWDKARSSHVSSGSFGQALQLVRDNTAQAGASGTITLDASASATNDFYNGCNIQIISGTGVGQQRAIGDYVGSTKVATIEPSWVTTPDNTSVFVVKPAVKELDLAIANHTTSGTLGKMLNDSENSDVDSSVDTGTVTATATEFAGQSALSSSDDKYNGLEVWFTSGSNIGIRKTVTDYVGSTRKFTFTGDPFPGAPSNGDTFKIG